MGNLPTCREYVQDCPLADCLLDFGDWHKQPNLKTVKAWRGVAGPASEMKERCRDQVQTEVSPSRIRVGQTLVDTFQCCNQD